jgi:ATP-dependent DNA helicase PIF1
VIWNKLMDGINQTKQYDLAELRKKYPNMGKKWAAEEDESLKKLYEEHRGQNAELFDSFLRRVSEQFGRAAGGMKARMARFFDDVPGYDYERDKYREEQKAKGTKGKFSADTDEILKNEYRKYLEGKKLTYAAFLKRMATRLGVEGKIISHRLVQLLGSVEKLGRDEVNPYAAGAAIGRQKLEEEIPQLNLSGNPEAQRALEILADTHDNLFLTGEAGTGKSTLLKYFRKTTGKNVVVLAPTGVAALNVEGQTIHSFCGFGPDITLQKVKKLAPFSPKFKLLQKLDTIIVDEISMVRADLLDCVDKFLRLNGPVNSEPFGGIQMVFIGDLYQLPPVDRDFISGDGLIKMYESPYFFDSKCFKNAQFKFIQLRVMYRQKDQVFIDVLGAVRNNAATREHLQILNQRAQTVGTSFTFEKFAIYLTPTNARARQVNNFFLERLKNPLKTYEGEARGSFENKEPPTDLHLQIKIGSQVMMLNNDYKKRWVNGTMGKVVGIETAPGSPPSIGGIPSAGGGGGISVESDDISFEDDEEKATRADRLVVELETGETVRVLPHTWEMFQFVLDKNTQSVDSRTTGTFSQYPLRLAWAVTIHKAQGKTFDKVYVDLATGTFAHGQLYVALSRCRTMEGLVLKRPVVPQDILLDSRIVEFLARYNAGQSDYYSTGSDFGL